MALTTAAAIRLAVQQRCGTDTTALPDATIDDSMWEVEEKIWSKLRCREMRDAYSFTYATGGVAFTTVEASGYLIEAISVNVTISSDDIRTPSPASEMTVRRILQEDDPTGPLVYGWVTQTDGTTKLVVAPEPTGATVVITYYKKFATLSSSTNAVFLAYPHIWLNGLTAEGFLYQQDFEMYQVYDKKFMEAIAVVTDRNRGATEDLKGNTSAPRYESWRP